jgi:hypothetical protein
MDASFPYRSTWNLTARPVLRLVPEMFVFNWCLNPLLQPITIILHPSLDYQPCKDPRDELSFTISRLLLPLLSTPGCLDVLAFTNNVSAQSAYTYENVTYLVEEIVLEHPSPCRQDIGKLSGTVLMVCR